MVKTVGGKIGQHIKRLERNSPTKKEDANTNSSEMCFFLLE